MMYGYDNGMSGWGYILMTAALLVIISMVVAAALVLIRSGATARRPAPDAMRRRDAERIIEQRFALGEVDQDEFRSRMDVLQSDVKQ